MHKVSQRAACEAMRAQHCTGGAERNAGEQSQRPPLFRAHMTFSRRRCHHLVVAKVHFFVECLKKPCFATVVPGPVLRDLSNETGDRRDPGPPRASGRGTWGSCAGRSSRCPHAEDTTRVPLGIPWAEKWPSAQIVRKCCNPDTAQMARCRVTICTVLTLRRCRPAPQLRLLCTGVGVVVRSLTLKLRPSR